jgi:threonylcarbamoyladenosine tRNA methylthiotransferase CDKAL1
LSGSFSNFCKFLQLATSTFLFLIEAFNVTRMRSINVLVKSFGCSTNLADGEILAGCLAEAGYKLTDSVGTASLAIFNTCAVKGPTEDRIIEVLRRVPSNKKIIVAGCLPLINFDRLCKEVRFDGVVGPAAGDRIVEVARSVIGGKKVIALKGGLNAKPRFDLPRFRLNSVRSIIPVGYGCLGSCAYCCVIFARGHLRSYGVQEIVERVRKDLLRDTREFWITSQDVACYGRDAGSTLIELLEAICSVEGDFRVRVGMMTPNTVMDILEELVKTFGNNHVFKFVHLPVQSGDEQVLKLMRRFYTIADFKKIVDAFRASIPEITLSTDVICGFPGETEEAFEKTLQLIEEAKPDVVNVSKFFARPKTLAAKMHENLVPSSEIKRRSTKAAELARKVAFERNQKWVGWTGEILVDEVGKIPRSWVGRNFAYKPVAVKNAQDLLGKTLHVKVVRAFATHLEGNLIE